MTKNKEYYYQCFLHREGGWYTVRWIPEKDAKKGKTVKLENEDWEVLEVYSKMESSKIKKGE